MTGCRAVRRRAQEVLDRRGDPVSDSLIGAHTDRCASCERFVDDLSRLSTIARSSPSADLLPTGAIADRVMAHVATRGRTPRTAARRPAWPPARAVGGALGLVLLVGVQIGAWRTKQLLGTPGAPGSVSSAPIAATPFPPALPEANLVGGPPDAVAPEPTPVPVTDDASTERALEPAAVPSTSATPNRRAHGSSARRAPIIPRGRSVPRTGAGRTPPGETQVAGHPRDGALSPFPAGVEMPGASGPLARSTRIAVPSVRSRPTGGGGGAEQVEIIAVSPGLGL